MITGELKNKIDSLWDIFAAGGLVNPLDVIEQITYLMFIRDLDDSENLKAKECEILGLPYESIFKSEVMIGDRVYTDIASGYNAGIDSILVLSGEGTREDAENTDTPPTYIFNGIRDVYNEI